MSENNFTKLKLGTIADILQTGLAGPLLKFRHLDLLIVIFSLRCRL